MSTEDHTTQEHLTEEQIARCADAMAMEEFSRITPQMRAHLESCDQCAEEVNMTAQIVRKNFSQSLSSALMNVQQPKVKNSWWIGVAAGVLLVLGLGYIFRDQLFFEDKQIAGINDSLIVSEDSTTNIAKEEPHQTQSLLVDTNAMQNDAQSNSSLAYHDNPQLEELVKRFSDGNLRGEYLDIKTPSVYTTSIAALKLSWETTEGEYLHVELYNSDANKIESLSSSTGEAMPKEVKSPGHYYWKLLNEDFDLLFCGKIVVTE